MTNAPKQKTERRKTKTASLDKCAFAPWLEETLPALINLDPETIAIVARSGEKDVAFTAYYDCNAEDKSVLAHHILSDIILDIVRANRDEIFADEDDGEEDEDDDPDASN